MTYFRCFAVGDNYRTPRLRPPVSQPSFSPAAVPAIAAGDATSGRRGAAIGRRRSVGRRLGEAHRSVRPSVRLSFDVIGNLRRDARHHRCKMAGADTPPPTTQFSSTSYCYDINAYWWRSGSRGAAWNQSAARAVAEIRRRDVSRAMQSRFSEDLTTRRDGRLAGRREWISARCPARRPEQYFLINTSKAIDATPAEYIISSRSR